MKKLIVALALASIFASPAFAKRAEYNFNNCTYTFYGSPDPYTRKPDLMPSLNINNGTGANGASAERLRTTIPMSIYEQTPQRTITIQPRRVQRQVVRNNYQPIQQQPVRYVYIPGQNVRSTQNNSQGAVGYQYNSNGAATYDSANGASTYDTSTTYDTNTGDSGKKQR